MLTAIGIVAALCAGLVVGTLYGKRAVRKVIDESIELTNDAESALTRIKEKL